MPRTMEDIQKIAEENGWKINPEGNIAVTVLNGQNKLYEKFGKYFCPCKISRVPNNICPCHESADEIAKDGKCHCRLFVKPKK